MPCLRVTLPKASAIFAPAKGAKMMFQSMGCGIHFTSLRHPLPGRSVMIPASVTTGM
jgi:hypothetical protein